MNILSQPQTAAVVWVADQGETESYHLQRSEQPDLVGFNRTGETTLRPARMTRHWVFTMRCSEPNNRHNRFDERPVHLSIRRNSGIRQSRGQTFLRKSAIRRSV